MAMKDKGDMSVRDAGKKGGERGGQKTKERYGTPFYRAIGKKGGDTVQKERGHEFYQEIGRKGGQRVRELIDAGKAIAGESLPDKLPHQAMPGKRTDDDGNH